MIRTKDELLNSFKERFGEDKSDDVISLLEDLSDTMDASADNISWKAKYDENDKAWREKYTARFYDGSDNPNPNNENKDKEDEPKTDISFNELFTERK